MNVALVGAVDFNESHFLTQRFDRVVAVDRGWESCQRAGIRAHVAIGDFDSLGYVPEGVDVMRYPSVKDESDMELALRYALDCKADSASIYGAWSQRLDHTLANIQVAAAYAARGLAVTGVADDFAVVLLAANPGTPHAPAHLSFKAFDPASLTGSYAPYLSLFAIGGKAQGVCIEGLQYALDDAPLDPTCSLGLSNQFRGVPARICVGMGSLAVVIPLDALRFATIESA